MEIFEDRVWQMSRGERAAVQGVLSELRPSLAIEIGSAEGACLRQIAAHALQVHSFDLQPPSLAMPGNVTLHTGDSHELLPPFLEACSEQGRNVDFVLVDGDHTPEGVRQDVEDLLDATALMRSVILIHDLANERVRRGVDAVHFAAWPKVCHVELDWIPGQLFAEPALRNELWFGIGLVVLDASQVAYSGGSVFEQRFHPAGALLAQMREQVSARERVPPGTQSPQDEAIALRKRSAQLGVEVAAAHTREAELKAELLPLRSKAAGADRALADIKSSVSWKVTQPLRFAKRRATARVKR